MLKNMTNLQRNIIEVVKGYTIAEVIHAFEIIKFDVILNDGDITNATADNIRKNEGLDSF